MSKGNSEERNDLGWYNITPWRTLHTLKPNKDFGINYTGDGWYEHKGSWMLLNKTLTGFCAMVWTFDPRPFLKKVADAEVRT